MLEEKIENFFRKKISKNQYAAAVSAIVFGLLAHGYMLNNKICYHDDDHCYFHLGGTYHLGRWLLGLIRDCFLKMGIQNYSTPLWNGMIYIFFLAISAVLITKLLKIDNMIAATIVGAILTVFPTTTAIFAYMFTAPYYGLSILMSVIAVYVTIYFRRGFIAGIVLLACATGIYQAYFGVASALFVFLLIISDDEFKKKWKQAWKYFGVLAGGMILYFILNKICSIFTGIDLIEYQGINNMTNVSVSGLVRAMWHAYKDFFLPMHGDFYGLSSVLFIQRLFAIQLFAGGLLLLYDMRNKKTIWDKLFHLILCLMIPLSINIVYVMTSSENSIVHTLMVVPYCFTILYPVALILKNKMSGPVRLFGYFSVVLMLIFFMKLDNTAYLKVTHEQEVAISYYNTLITRIKGLEGYSQSLPVLLYGKEELTDSTIVYMPEYNTVNLQGYETNERQFIGYYTEENFIRIHCGYVYAVPQDKEKIIASPEFEEMPCYPEDGGIKIIDDVIVVKMAEQE